ncbi:hexokinase [Parabacteroides sp. PFB2-12]|uniref:hexokinase n=1 Tax=unclassified Parabacteroides TaxID=2649774 RepID=UPI002476240F|nr:MULTISPECIES: hexokinase [unclassified Parabacteroides]MDH6344265.1 hexokinase [Parabacteroides sp. PM6-13]MDH6391160.1 hexokinase [Parabacteroides sp. PFB2-12]
MKKNIFELNTQQLKEIAEALQREVEKGLAEPNCQIQCLPTYISPKAPTDKDKAVVLDLGGTNYRVATVDFAGGTPTIHPENGWKKDLRVMKTPGFTQANLFKELADPILEIKREKEMPIGYCFSYPADSMPNGDGVLLRWTKGVNIDEMVGQPIGQPLMDHLNEKSPDVPFTGIKVINDTVASLFAGYAGERFDAYIGLIVGTGTNMATFVDSKNIEKLDEAHKNFGSMPINLESGNFFPPHLTSIDNTVDALSGSRGSQRFEKAISGMYLGEILKAVFPLEEFEKKFDAERLTSMISYPDIYKEDHVQVANWIYIRSAKLVAASLAGLINVLIAQNPKIRKVCLTAEGSLFWSSVRFGKSYKDMVQEELTHLLSEFGHTDMYIHIEPVENANLIGTAIAAIS